jgi:methionyl aminopeptidase
MTIETAEDLAALRRIGKIVALARDTMGSHVAPGITTRHLDEIGLRVLEEHGARSAPQLAYQFPGTTCISVNDELAHGIPGERVLRDGDLVNIDVSAELEGYFADTGASFPVGNITAQKRRLLDATRGALDVAMKQAVAGKPITNVARSVEKRARAAGFRVVSSLCGHGVGRSIHEEPSIPNAHPHRVGGRFWEGLVMTIEPFLTNGATSVYEDDDGWTLKTPDESFGAQFEHTMVITQGQPIVLTV